MKQLCIILYLWLAASLAQPASAFEPPAPPEPIANSGSALPVSLPFTRLPGGQYMVPVYINDAGPFSFIVDSAASRSAIYGHALGKVTPAPALNEPQMVHGIFKSALRPSADISRLGFAGRVHVNLPVIVLENTQTSFQNVDGVLGLDVLRRYALAFDHSSNTISLLQAKPHKLGAYKGWKRIRLSSRLGSKSGHGFYYTTTEIAGHDVPTLVDTGASYSSISWNSIKGTSLERYKRKLKIAWKAEGAIGTFSPRMNVRVYKITIGGQELTDHPFTIANMDNFPITRNGQYKLAIAGIALMDNRDFVFDFPGKQILIEKPAR